MKKPLLDKAPRQLGSIRGDEVLPLRLFAQRLDFADKCISDIQKQGLRTVLFGRQKFVLGGDALDFFNRLADRQQAEKGNRDADPT